MYFSFNIHEKDMCPLLPSPQGAVPHIKFLDGSLNYSAKLIVCPLMIPPTQLVRHSLSRILFSVQFEKKILIRALLF